MNKIILCFMLFAISGLSFSGTTRKYEYHEKFSGKFLRFGRASFCTHSETDLAFSYRFRGDTAVISGLYVINKKDKTIATYRKRDWVRNGELYNSRVFKRVKGDKSFSKYIAIKQTTDGSDNISLLSFYKNGTSFKITSIDEGFGYTFVSYAYAKVSTCAKKF